MVKAAQARAALQYKVCDWFHIFGEYRYLFVDPPTCVPTHFTME